MNNNIIKEVIFCICISFVFTTGAIAIENPISNQTSTLNWRENGVNYSEELLVGDYYNPYYTGWCNAGHVTTSSNKYTHVHITSSFDYTYGSVTITESMVDDYWDNRYAGFDDLGGLDQSSNCYGYATGHNIWIDGIGIILNDEYTETNETDADIVKLSGHMLKITGYTSVACDVTHARTTHEKNRDSGIYKNQLLYEVWYDTSGFINNAYNRN
jgi:hypothetical protein